MSLMVEPGIKSKRDVLLGSLCKFYEHDQNLRVLTNVLSNSTTQDDEKKPTGRQQHISLRILDWLVTNYAKKHNIVYLVPGDDGLLTTFNMFLAYKSQLKAYSKRFFDPFCRRERLQFVDADGETFNTTVGQLNFFRWALLNGVVDYGTRHNAAIEADMLQSIKRRSAATPKTQVQEAKHKRRELSRAAIKGCTNTRVKVVVRFS